MFFEKVVPKIFGKFLENHLQESTYWKLITKLNMSSVADIYLGISQKYSEQKNLPINPSLKTIHILLKSTSGRVLLMRQHSKKKKLVKVNPPQSWLWEQNVNGTTAVAAVMILKVVDNWKSMLHINILKKVRLWALITFRYRTCMFTLQYLSDWCLHGILPEIPEEKHLKLSDYLNQI